MRIFQEATFKADFKALKREHQRQFIEVVTSKFNPACDAFAADATVAWPASLRVKSMKYAPGIYEMTWSFKSPDGRATFQLLNDERGTYCRWRRIGNHSIFREP